MSDDAVKWDGSYTIAMVKSGAVIRRHTMAILSTTGIIGAKVVVFRYVNLDDLMIRHIYSEHLGKHFWPNLYHSVANGVVIALLNGPNVLERWRGLIGATDPEAALPGTIRHDYGVKGADNAVHGSASKQDAFREYSILFGVTTGGGHDQTPPTRLSPEQWPLATLLFEILERLDAMSASTTAIDAQITQLQADVTAQTTVIESATTLLQSLSAQLSAALAQATSSGDLTALQALDSSLKANTTALAGAVTANTANTANTLNAAPTSSGSVTGAAAS